MKSYTICSLNPCPEHFRPYNSFYIFESPAYNIFIISPYLPVLFLIYNKCSTYRWTPHYTITCSRIR